MAPRLKWKLKELIKNQSLEKKYSLVAEPKIIYQTDNQLSLGQFRLETAISDFEPEEEVGQFDEVEEQTTIIPKDEIIKLFLLSKTFLNNFIADLSDKFVFLSKKLKFFAFKTLKEKIANYLYSLPKNKKEEIIIPNSLEELANYFSVERPSLSRVLLQLEKEKIIKRENKKVKILDKEKLFI